jgi:mersacidin/lichenicidin family type 2 lantibiotic
MENGSLTQQEQYLKSLPASEIIRLWKDEEYRESQQLGGLSLPGSPVGVVELKDEELKEAIQAARICSENASISTTWCDNPNVC